MNKEFMMRAIELARKGEGFVNPNPLVGAVIVRDGRIIGEGFHERYGQLHAERNALKNCKEDPSGAEMYVTLEPCCHYGKNPPCTDAVIAAGIKHVYVGSFDPNPLVAGKGIEKLRNAGIEVTENVMRAECDALNDIFFHYITTGTPYVILKTAMSLDGKTAAYTGNSKWITNEAARADVHKTRKRVAAILVGIGTVLADDPMLNCRCDDPSDPVRIICDTNLRIPLTSKIVQTAKEIPTYIATRSENKDMIEKLEEKAVKIIHMPESDNGIDLVHLMKELGKMQLDSVLIEGGAAVHTSALQAGIVNKLQVYIAPKILGGDGRSVFMPMGIAKASDALQLGVPKITSFDDNILLEYEVK